MLKIKDSVKKEDLEKFLLEKHFYYMKDLNSNDILRKYGHFKICKNNHIMPLNGGGNKRFDIIYDLIKADMVEKV